MSTSTPPALADLAPGESYQFPASVLHPSIGGLSITPEADRLQVTLSLLLPPQRKHAHTGIALDGSDSMMPVYGQAWSYSENWDSAVLERLIAEGKGQMVEVDGDSYFESTEAGRQELVAMGYIIQTPNEVESVAQEIIPFLAEALDAHGGVTAIYWACGEHGEDLEMVGDLSAEAARHTAYQGPQDWGRSTQLMPALRYFTERFGHDADGLYVFVSDGRVDDFEAVKRFTAEMAEHIYAGDAQPFKCVLIGVGPAIDETQMYELDTLPAQLSLPVQIWSHKLAASMEELRLVMGEVVAEHAIVAASGRVVDDQMDIAANFPAGVPMMMRFSLPRTARAFSLQLPGQTLEQRLDS